MGLNFPLSKSCCERDGAADLRSLPLTVDEKGTTSSYILQPCVFLVLRDETQQLQLVSCRPTPTIWGRVAEQQRVMMGPISLRRLPLALGLYHLASGCNPESTVVPKGPTEVDTG